MSLYWGSYGSTWTPEGGEHRDWRDVAPGDLVVFDREIWRVIENRPVPVADWDDNHREHFEAWKRKGVTEEEWRFRPLVLLGEPVKGGEREHLEVRPYAGLRARAYVLHPHYPVCSDCGEPWPCRELDITREVRRQSAEMERLARIMPGCCWSCGELVTSRQKAIAFEGDNLLLPGAPPPVFHLRSGKPYCSSAAVGYEKRWVAAEAGRHPRLYCTGHLIVHVDGPECTGEPFCAGGHVQHPNFMDHRRDAGYVRKCLRCMDACAQRGDHGTGGLIVSEYRQEN
jgi:hypothetical protein